MKQNVIIIIFGFLLILFVFGCDFVSYIVLANDTNHDLSLIVKADNKYCSQQDSLPVFRIDSLGNYSRISSSAIFYSVIDSTSFNFKLPKNNAVRIGGQWRPIRKVIIVSPNSVDSVRYSGNIKNLKQKNIIWKDVRIENLRALKLSNIVSGMQ